MTDGYEQRIAALERANAARFERVRLKRELSGVASRAEAWAILADVIENPPLWVRSARVYVLLLACRRTGEHGAQAFLRQFGLHTDVKVSALSDSRRRSIAAALRACSTSERVAA